MNQCDGCMRGLPVEYGLHRDSTGLPVMACTADLYAAPDTDLEALLDIEARPLAAPRPEMCACGCLPAPCGCVSFELPAPALLPAKVRLAVLIEAVQYAVNRLDADKSQPQVAGDLAVALAYARSARA
jgi:hypothetical protein